MAVDGRLKSDGWYLTPEGIALLSENEDDISVKALVKKALDTDLKNIGGSVIPEDLAKGKKLPDGCVLQVIKINNVSAPKINEESNHAPRLLKIVLTDGVATCTALDLTQIKSIDVRTPPGTKVRLKGSSIPYQQGYLLLNSANIEVLGGKVEALIEKWKLKENLVNYKRSKITSDTGPPPWVPFGQKIAGNVQDLQGRFKSLDATASKEVKENDTFELQRKATIAEIAKIKSAGCKTFGGGKFISEKDSGSRYDKPKFGSGPTAISATDKTSFVRSLGDSASAGRNDRGDMRESRGRPERSGRGRGRRDGGDDDEDGVSVAPSRPSTLFDFLQSKIDIIEGKSPSESANSLDPHQGSSFVSSNPYSRDSSRSHTMPHENRRPPFKEDWKRSSDNNHHDNRSSRGSRGGSSSFRGSSSRGGRSDGNRYSSSHSSYGGSKLGDDSRGGSKFSGEDSRSGSKFGGEDNRGGSKFGGEDSRGGSKFGDEDSQGGSKFGGENSRGGRKLGESGRGGNKYGEDSRGGAKFGGEDGKHASNFSTNRPKTGDRHTSDHAGPNVTSGNSSNRNSIPAFTNSSNASATSGRAGGNGKPNDVTPRPTPPTATQSQPASDHDVIKINSTTPPTANNNHCGATTTSSVDSHRANSPNKSAFSPINQPVRTSNHPGSNPANMRPSDPAKAIKGSFESMTCPPMPDFGLYQNNCLPPSGYGRPNYYGSQPRQNDRSAAANSHFGGYETAGGDSGRNLHPQHPPPPPYLMQQPSTLQVNVNDNFRPPVSNFKGNVNNALVTAGDLTSTSDQSAVRSGGRAWQSGDECLAKYWEDNKHYPAVVHAVGPTGTTCVVLFPKYGNYEEVFVQDMKPWKGKEEQGNYQMNSGTVEFRRGGTRPYVIRNNFSHQMDQDNFRQATGRPTQQVYVPPAQRQ